MNAHTAPPISVVDLFAGCGGFTEGFRSFRPEGVDVPVFRSVAAVEHDKAAATTFAANFATAGTEAEHVFAIDIEKWDPEPFAGAADVILGGPPCQGFSGLGKEDPLDPRNKLWREYMRVVKKINPKVFVIENVDRFMRSPEYAALKEAVESPRGQLRNYTLAAGVLNSADYGVPQRRRRAIVIATHRDLAPIVHPPKTHRKQGPSDSGLFEVGLQEWVSIDHIFDHTPKTADIVELPDRMCNPLGLANGLAGPFLTSELHIGRTPKPLSLARYAVIPPGGNRHDLRAKWAQVDGERTYLSTESWDKHNSGTGDVMGRMKLGLPSVTIRTEFYKPEKGRYLHPEANRPITHMEAAMIQGFPMDFRWCGTKVEIARQIGNAVPVGLARAIAGVVYQRLRG